MKIQDTLRKQLLPNILKKALKMKWLNKYLRCSSICCAFWENSGREEAEPVSCLRRSWKIVRDQRLEIGYSAQEVIAVQKTLQINWFASQSHLMIARET